MNTKTTPSRISWIDMAKGYGTILVILAHIGTGTGRLWIYTFHMPLFFFLSGYVFSTKYEFREFVGKKVKTIIVPYFCLGIPMILYETFVTQWWKEDKFGVFLGLVWDLIWQRRLWTLWYIAVLFFLNIFFFFLVKKCKNEQMLAVISLLGPVIGLVYYALGGGYLPWNIDVCVMALPFFYAGYFMKNHAAKIEIILDAKWKKAVLFASMLLLNLVFGSLSVDADGTGLEMFYSKYGSNPLFTYIAAFAGIICVVLVTKAFSCRAICYLGENTMLYYAWHQTIMMPVVEKWMKMCGITSLVEKGTMCYNLIWLLGILAITTVLIWIMKKLGLKFMLGK